MSTRNASKPYPLFVRQISLVTLLACGFGAVAPMAYAQESARMPSISSKQVQKELRRVDSLVEEVRALFEEDPTKDLYDLESFNEFETVILDAKAEGRDVSLALRSLTGLLGMYEEDSAYLLIVSQILNDLTLTTEPADFTEREKEAVLAFATSLPDTQGNTGRIQKIRLVNLYREAVPSMQEGALKTLSVEELLHVDMTLASKRYVPHVYPPEDYLALDSLFDDPTLASVESVARILKSGVSENRIDFAERAAAVTRYLYFKNLRPSKKNVHIAERAIADARLAWGEYEVLRGTVLFAGSSDEFPRFLDEKNLARLQELRKDTHVFSGAGDGDVTSDSVFNAKSQMLESIAATEGSITAMFDMHGHEDLISFGTVEADDGLEVQVVLTPSQLADAFAARYADAALETQAKTVPDVVVFLSCLSGTYAMQFLDEMRSRGLLLPIVITAGEAGQDTVSDFAGHESFERRFLFKGSQKIKDIYDSHLWGIWSNPILIVPQKGSPTKPLQVAYIVKEYG